MEAREQGSSKGRKEQGGHTRCSGLHVQAQHIQQAHAHARDPRNGATVLTIGAGSTAGISHKKSVFKAYYSSICEYMVNVVLCVKTICCILILYALYYPEAVGMPVMLCAVW